MYIGYRASTLPLSVGPAVRIPSVVSVINYQENADLQPTVCFLKMQRIQRDLWNIKSKISLDFLL